MKDFTLKEQTTEAKEPNTTPIHYYNEFTECYLTVQIISRTDSLNKGLKQNDNLKYIFN